MKTQKELTALLCKTYQHLAIGQAVDGALYYHDTVEWVRLYPLKTTTNEEFFRRACYARCGKAIRGRIFIEVDQ